MFRISSVSLFTAYIFLLRFVSIAQIGPDWEIPYEILKKSKMMLVFGCLFFVLSCIFVIISYESFKKYPIYIKMVYMFMLIIALIVIGLGFSGVFYQLPSCFPMLSNIVRHVFWPGLLILLSLLLILLISSEKKL